MFINDEYSNSYPKPENALSIFAGEWASIIPNVDGGGNIPLFYDQRVLDFIDMAGGVTNKKCLELGPLEGGHTYALSNNGAAEILSIESNQRAFLKCLITKEILGYRAKFMCGDFVEFVSSTTDIFDFTLMSGVLYHMISPHQLIMNVARISNQIGVWTHYYDETIIRNNPVLNTKFAFRSKMVVALSMKIKLYKQFYLKSAKLLGFCGGKEEFSYWMEKSDILELFNKLGFIVTLIADDPFHPNGPSMSFFAQRKP